MPSDLGFLQELMLPGMVAEPAPAPAPDVLEQIIKAGSQRVMGTSPLAPNVEEIVRQAAESKRTGYGMLPPGVTPEMEAQGRRNLAEWFGPQVAGALGLPHPQPSWQAGAGGPAEPPMTEADLLAMAGAQPQPATSQSLGVSLPPGTDLSGFNRAISGLQDVGRRMGEASREGKAALGEAIGRQQAAAEKQAQIAADRQAAIATEMGNLESAMASQQEAQRAREQEVRKAVDGKMDAFSKAIEAANSASIDPDRWYRDSTGGTFGRRLGSAVAMALGAVGSAFTRGPNYALQIIQSAIDRDLMAQRAEMAKKQAGVGMAQNAVAMAREQFSDEQARGAAEQAAMLSRAQRMIALSTAQSGSKEEIAKGEALSADLRARFAEQMAKANQAELAAEGTRQAQIAGLELQGAQIKGADAKLRWQAKQAASKAGLLMPPGLRIADPRRAPPTKEQLKEITEKSGKLRRLQTAAAAVLDERKKSGNFAGRFGPAGEMKVKEFQLAYADAIGIKGEQIPKFLSEPEKHGLPTSTTDLGYLPERVQTTLQNARGAIESVAGAYNLALDDVQAVGGGRRVK